jgi:mono/diheme cytochrome c family protein
LVLNEREEKCVKHAVRLNSGDPAMRLGKHHGIGRELLPPMPIPAYKNFTDADLDAIFAYLQSIPAVKNKVPAPQPPAAAASAPAKK